MITVTTTNNPDNYLIKLLNNQLARHHRLTELPKWKLEHRYFRENRPHDHDVKAQGSVDGSTGHLQTLYRSYVTDLMHVAVTNAKAAAGTDAKATASAEPAVVVAIPAAAGSGDDFIQLLGTRLAALWTHRQIIQVPEGEGWGIGGFNVRFGELKQGRGGAALARAVVVEIEWLNDEDGERSSVEDVISAVWAGLGMPDARRFFLPAGSANDFAAERLWFEALKVRV